MVVAPAAVAMVWRWLFNSEFGLLNKLLNTVGIGEVNWLSGSEDYSLCSSNGRSMVCNRIQYGPFSCGTWQEIPRDFYEASEIDGANVFQQFFHITLPQISPTMFFVLVTRIIASFQVFDMILMMVDRSSPALPKTQSLVYLFYRYAFVENNKGYGSAIVVLLLVIIMIITVIQMIMQKKWVHYE